MSGITLAEVLARETREGDLYETLPDGRLRCFACGHCCPLPEGAIGVCKVRFNEGGRLLVPWGYVGGVQCDPIEKKPFFHAHPGALAYSFGMLGCDLHCSYCQNWVTSQALRDPAAVAPPLGTSPGNLVADALQQQARVMVSTYNEPLITSEWAVAVFKEAKAAGLVTGYVSNGNGTPQVLEYIRPWVDLYKVDLKSFDDRHYRELGGRLQPILDTIRRLHAMEFWVEIVTLLIPGFNDARDEIERLTAFVASVSPDIPWHVTAFHGDYKMTDPQNTTAEMLLAAADIGRANGLRYVYAGNLPGCVGDLEDTRCAACGDVVVARYGYHIRDYRITPDGRCPSCATRIPGRWSRQFDGQIASRPFIPGRRGIQFKVLGSDF
ncbi:MAG TPA: AmmeMemoRadiSam system radical SAM enzyme [Vicinamibacterales bacterium]|jgi:pyruvate formate lyase activating enzyme|nr:AmmeMemoRadiSam system radical SAM enzyme [Vicinamibacterales bacterium]